MRKFRFIADPKQKNYCCGIVKDSIYLGESFIESYDSRPPFKIQDIVESYPSDWEEVTESEAIQTPNLSKREYFAGLAMVGYLSNSNPDVVRMDQEEIAEYCINHADSLLKQLENGK